MNSGKYETYPEMNTRLPRCSPKRILMIIKHRYRRRKVTDQVTISRLRERVIFEKKKVSKIAKELDLNFSTARALIYNTNKNLDKNLSKKQVGLTYYN